MSESTMLIKNWIDRNKLGKYFRICGSNNCFLTITIFGDSHIIGENHTCKNIWGSFYKTTHFTYTKIKDNDSVKKFVTRCLELLIEKIKTTDWKVFLWSPNSTPIKNISNKDLLKLKMLLTVVEST